jgi:hypothetical protein
VHNWAQFKFGVFPEYSFKDLDNSEEFYHNSNGDVEATRCNLNLSGKIKNSLTDQETCKEFKFGLPSKDECMFEDDINPLADTYRIGSLMYKPFLTQVTRRKLNLS